MKMTRLGENPLDIQKPPEGTDVLVRVLLGADKVPTIMEGFYVEDEDGMHWFLPIVHCDVARIITHWMYKPECE